MKKKFVTKKKVFAIIFAFAVVIIMGLNVFLFPKLLKFTPTSSDVVLATDNQIDLNTTNEALRNVITEEAALNIANKNILEEDVPFSFNFDSSSVVSKYVYDLSSFPAKNPIWVIVYINSYENYDLPMPKEVIDRISEFAWESGEVWMNDNGDVFGHYDKYTEYVIVEVDAVTGEYNGFTYMSDENDVEYENSSAKYIEKLYDIDLNIDFV